MWDWVLNDKSLARWIGGIGLAVLGMIAMIVPIFAIVVVRRRQDWD